MAGCLYASSNILRSNGSLGQAGTRILRIVAGCLYASSNILKSNGKSRPGWHENTENCGWLLVCEFKHLQEVMEVYAGLKKLMRMVAGYTPVVLKVQDHMLKV